MSKEPGHSPKQRGFQKPAPPPPFKVNAAMDNNDPMNYEHIITSRRDGIEPSHFAIKTILEHARELIEDPNDWTQNCDARLRGKTRNICCAASNPNASIFTAYGAIIKGVLIWADNDVTSDLDYFLDCLLLAAHALAVTATIKSHTRISTRDALRNWNNTHTHDEVLEAFDQTILVLENAS